MTAASRTALQRLSVVAAVVGAVMVAVTLLASFWPRVGGDPVPQRWSGETLYLHAEGRQGAVCVVSPSTELARSVTVPGSPGRGLKLFGTRLRLDGPATIACPPTVTATRGPILLVYPLAENDPWVIIPAAVLLAAGWAFARPPRSCPRIAGGGAVPNPDAITPSDILSRIADSPHGELLRDEQALERTLIELVIASKHPVLAEMGRELKQGHISWQGLADIEAYREVLAAGYGAIQQIDLTEVAAGLDAEAPGSTPAAPARDDEPEELFRGLDHETRRWPDR